MCVCFFIHSIFSLLFLNRFRFWQWGRWIEVKVDDRLPTRGDRPAHMHCAQIDVYWAALLEKAYAKLYGGYAFLKYGTIGRALQDLTGAVVQRFVCVCFIHSSSRLYSFIMSLLSNYIVFRRLGLYWEVNIHFHKVK